MDETRFAYWKTIAFLGSLAMIVAAERLFIWKRFAGPGSGRLRNVWLAATDALVLGVVCAGCSCAASRFATGSGLGLFNRIEAPPWLAVLVTVVSFDALAWAWHRANHRVPALWRFHRVHHSDPAFDATTSFRFHPVELLLSVPVRLLLVLALGAPVVGILVFEVTFGFFNLFVHANLRLPKRLESALAVVFVHPALHRLHHSRVIAESSRNFGTILSVWDRAGRTMLRSDSARAVDVGLDDLDGGRVAGLLAQLRLPFR